MKILVSLKEKLLNWFNLAELELSSGMLEDEANFIKTEFTLYLENKYPDYLKNYKHSHLKTIEETHKKYGVPIENFPSKEVPNIGLALSGGGIRSAAFGIGVTQALNNPTSDNSSEPTLFNKLTHLSTVSGGGYAGASLTWFIKKYGVYPFGELTSFCGSKKELVEKKINSVSGFIPKLTINIIEKLDYLFTKKTTSNETQTSNSEDLKKINLPNNILSHIRLHGKYLTPPELPIISLLASIINSTVHSLTAYILLLSIPIFLLMQASNNTLIIDAYENNIAALKCNAPEKIKQFLSIYETNEPSKEPSTPPSATTNTKQTINATAPTTVHQCENFIEKSTEHKDSIRMKFTLFFIILSAFGLLTFATTSFIYGTISFFTDFFSKRYKLRINTQRILALQIKLIFFFLMLLIIPWLLTYIENNEHSSLLGTGGAGAGIIALIMSIVEFLKQFKSTASSNSLYGNLMRDAIAITFIYFIVTMSYLVSETIYLNESETIIYTAAYFLFSISLIFLVNINNVSPHRMYRDRLMDTFMTDPNTPSYKSLAKKGEKANAYTLKDIATNKVWSPYHLINTNIILTNSRNPQFNSRIGDSFILSPKWCGSDATGYVPTDKFALGSMTLATATSISGAAANPHAGVGGQGHSTTPLVSFIMTFFGLRLGYWIKNPRHWRSRFKRFSSPNYHQPGAYSLFNIGHTEESLYIELSDGGHFDNTGIYELIRRRIPWIIISDGSADVKTTFEDLGNALSRIRIDFGVDIRFSDPKFDFNGIMPGCLFAKNEPDNRQINDEKYQLAERGYTIGDIIYPATETQKEFIGTLIYIKATMIRELPADIYAYKADHADFPNEPTSDQFFDERQFESYRELGYQITKKFLQNETAMKRLP